MHDRRAGRQPLGRRTDGDGGCGGGHLRDGDGMCRGLFRPCHAYLHEEKSGGVKSKNSAKEKTPPAITGGEFFTRNQSFDPAFSLIRQQASFAIKTKSRIFLINSYK